MFVVAVIAGVVVLCRFGLLGVFCVCRMHLKVLPSISMYNYFGDWS